VKHNDYNYEQPYVHLFFKIKENKLTFIGENSKRQSVYSGKTTKGIGLQNIKRRLDLLYGTNYNLSFEDTATKYCTRLNIDL